ncbi:hypothetical protein DL89DRAFT_271380, partial [Linderina pennispora]
MSLETYTCSSLRNLEYHKNIVLYNGRFDTRQAAARSGMQAYRIVAQFPHVTLLTVDVNDDTTVVAGVMPTSGSTVANALIDKVSTRSASAIARGVPYKMEQRDMQLGWKFTDAQGVKYKWNTKALKTQWELLDSKKAAIATFDCTKFWKDGPGILEFKTGISNELRVLSLLALGITALTITRTHANSHSNVAIYASWS